MAKLKLICLFFTLIFLIQMISASAGAVVLMAAASSSAAANNVRQQQSAEYQKQVYSNIASPLDWATEHNCVLTYPNYNDKEVGKFYCEITNPLLMVNDKYILHTDGKGSVIKYQFEDNTFQNSLAFFVIYCIYGAGLILFIVSIIYLIKGGNM